jgi:hypothetical protein
LLFAKAGRHLTSLVIASPKPAAFGMHRFQHLRQEQRFEIFGGSADLLFLVVLMC